MIAIQTFGDFLGFNPHLHILISDGCFHENGLFIVSPAIDTKTLENIFRDKVLKMLIAKEIPVFDALVQEKMKEYPSKYTEGLQTGFARQSHQGPAYLGEF